MKEILKVFVNSKIFDFGWVAKVDLILIILAEESLNRVKKRGGKGIGYANKNLTLFPKDYTNP